MPKQTNSIESPTAKDTAPSPAADLEADVVSAPAAIDIAALKAQLEAEIRAKIAEEQKNDPGYSSPGVRTVTQEAIAQTKVVSGNVSLGAPEAIPKNILNLGDGTIRQDY